MKEELTSKQQIRRRTIKAFIGFGLASLVPFSVWKWIMSQPKLGRIPAPLRRVLEFNEKVTGSLVSTIHEAPTFPKSMASKWIRTNGLEGLRTPVATDYKIRIEQPEGSTHGSSFEITMDDILALPKQEIVFEFKCIEGWAQIQHWGGVRFIDFVKHYRLSSKANADSFKYVAMETPDKGYFVGIDMPSALHPQTLLAYEMNGQPITEKHGAPLRLIIPVKYGVKNLKRIGLIRFTDERPRDFWAELGYDYFAGL